MLERSPLHNPLGGLPAGAGDASVGRADAEERFPALLESAPDAMVIVDRAGLIRLVNPQTEAVFGYWREEVLSRPSMGTLPELPGLRTAGRYLSAMRGGGVGGDWFDLVRLGAGRAGVLIGDVMGPSCGG
jgi:PAS domain-containing protein